MQKSSNLQRDWEIVGMINASRVQKKQLKMIHKKSGIECMLRFDNNNTTVESASKIIQNYMVLNPMCKDNLIDKYMRCMNKSYFFLTQGKNLIAYVRAWQNCLNEVTAKDGSIAFQFNTYIISVLVIFFLQVKYNFPLINELESVLSANTRFPLKGTIAQLMKEFFEFYANVYEVHKKVISLNMGRWQDREAPPEQKLNSPEQQR